MARHCAGGGNGMSGVGLAHWVLACLFEQAVVGACCEHTLQVLGGMGGWVLCSHVELS